MDTPVAAPITSPAPAPVTPMSTAKNNVLMAILAYIGPLVIVSYLVSKDDPFVKFHIKQGLVLLVVNVGVWIVGMFMPGLWMIFQLVNLATLILAIVGIVNAAQGKQKNLPLVGEYSSYFHF